MMRMRAFLLFGLMGLAFLLTGCASSSQKQAREDLLAVARSESAAEQTGSLAEARAQEQAGRYLEALEAYAALTSDSAPDLALQARMGQARCLLRMDHPAAALIRLEPLPEDPRTAIEAQHVALAGEILMHLGRHEAAFYQLHKLSRLPEVLAEPWSGSAFANLGASALHQNRLDIAGDAYRIAIRQFNRFNRPTEAGACRQILQQIANQQEGHPHE